MSLQAERAFGAEAMPRRMRPQQPEPASSGVAAVAISQPQMDLFGHRIGSSSSVLPLTDRTLSREEKIAQLNELDQTQVRVCTRCRLCQHRTHTVFGEGDADAKIFFIGEGPGENEDLQGRPFVGRAGELLNKWIAAMGLSREQVYIGNIVKCRPPDNREPAPDEVASCSPYLEKQIEIICPQVIVALGRPATQHLLQTKLPMNKLRGQWYQWRGIKLMPTYHPAYVLRNYSYETRSAVWSDLQQVMKFLGLVPPQRAGQKQS